MPFRDDPMTSAGAFDPRARFLELFTALDAGRGWLGDKVATRLGATTLVLAPGTASELAHRTRAADGRLAESFGWTSGVSPSVRIVLGAALARDGSAATDVIGEVDRFLGVVAAGRAWMRELGMRRAGVHEVLAMMVLDRATGGRCERSHVERMRDVYEACKRYHWFLTGPEDFATCAMLATRPTAPEAIVDRVEEVYVRLANAPKVWGGEQLQTAAHVLGLLDVSPGEAADRFLAIATALRDADVPVRAGNYDEVAVLAFLPRSPGSIAAYIADVRTRLTHDLGWTEQTLATGIATSLCFAQVVSDDRDGATGVLADTKLLLDMQSIVTMRQASAVAVAATAG